MARILVVDDEYTTRQLLDRIIRAAHPEYEIVQAADGTEGLQLVSSVKPDLVLMDVLMPDMNGYEVCGKLKATPGFGDIPVIFISALEDTGEKIRGFQAGGADFITKPINAAETVARVDAHLRIKQYQDQLKEMADKLLRAQSALIESSKMSAVGSLAAGVAHEFNNLLLIMKGNIDLCPGMKSSAEMIALRDVLLHLIERGGSIVNSLLNFSHYDASGRFKDVSVARVIEETILLLQSELSARHIGVHTDISEVPPVLGQPDQLSQVFVNIIRNAIEAMERAEERRLTIAARACDEAGNDCAYEPGLPCARACVKIVISDTGPGIPDGIKDKIFEPFVTTKGVLGGGDDTAPGTGLGLSISYGIIKRHNGRIFADPGNGRGASFTIILRASRREPAQGS